jgi:endo-1,4-beta-xylanase
MNITRRKFLRDSAFAGVGATIGVGSLRSAPSILTRPRTSTNTSRGELLFRPAFVQAGRGPHLLDWAYASDTRWDAFHSNISASAEGVKISDTEGIEKFGINVRWNVEGFGYIFITADNAGEFYTIPASGKNAVLHLNYELASSRVARNRKRVRAFAESGWVSSRESAGYLALSEEYLADAGKVRADHQRCGELAQRSLFYAMWGSEMIEMEKAQFDILKRGYRPEFLMGCDARGIYEMHEDLFMELFTQLFDFATITYFWGKSGNIEEFEPEEGKTRYDMRDLAFKKLRERNLAVEGRSITWFHKWVTPDWIKSKTFDQLKTYVEKHAREMVAHYGDGMWGWEVMNEFHDWANEVQCTPEQTIELTRLACDVARDTAPDVQRVINNCCPYAEYVQLKQWSGQEAKYRQRTPWQFMRDLTDAGVDFTVIGQQMYFPYRDLQDIVMYLERFEVFKKPLHLSEVGTSAGPTDLTVKTKKKPGLPKDPYIWHRPWDEELQADWIDGVYKLAYSKPFIQGVHWFDFLDPFCYIENGGILRTSQGEKKAGYDRLLKIRSQWKNLSANKAGKNSHG